MSLPPIITIGKVVWSLKDRGVGKLVTLTPLEGYGTYTRWKGTESCGYERLDEDLSEEKP